MPSDKLHNREFNKEKFDEEMRRALIKTQLDTSDIVFKAAQYSLFSGGKRLRPRLMQLTYNLFTDAPLSSCRPFQFAIEMIHSYSLIHDDLPAMDNDDMRRGQASCHKAFGEATAILAGDLLLNAAYEIMANACLFDSGKRSVVALNLIAQAAGGRGMILGQSRDIAFEDIDSVEREDIEKMASLKTAALIRAAIVVGAVLAHADSQEQDLLAEFGKNLGLAFQIRDDLLDCIADPEKLGKSVGKDERDEKKTFVTVLGVDAASKLLSDKSEKAKLYLLKLEEVANVDTSSLRILTENLESRDM